MRILIMAYCNPYMYLGNLGNSSAYSIHNQGQPWSLFKDRLPDISHITLPSMKLTFSHLKMGRAPKGNYRIQTNPFSGATVDGWNHATLEVGSLSHYLQGFIHSRWLFGKSAHQQYVSFRVPGISRPRYQRVPMRDANVVPFRRLSQWNCVWPRWHSLAQLKNRPIWRKGLPKWRKQSQRRFSNTVNINILKKKQTHNITQQKNSMESCWICFPQSWYTYSCSAGFQMVKRRHTSWTRMNKINPLLWQNPIVKSWVSLPWQTIVKKCAFKTVLLTRRSP